MTELLDLAAGMLDGAHSGEDVEVYCSHRISTAVQADTGGDIRHVGRAETRGVGVRLIEGTRMGYASTADLSPAALALTLERARSNARLSDADPANLLPDPEHPPVATVAAYSPAVVTATPLQVKIDAVAALARRVVSLDPRVQVADTTEYHDEYAAVSIASTRGMRVQHERAHVEVWTDVLGSDSHGGAGDYAYWCGRDLRDVDIEGLARDAVLRTVRLLGPQTAAPAGLPVVLDRAVVAELLAVVGRSFAGAELRSGRVPFGVPAGCELAAPCVTLVDDGTLESAPAAAAYDDEGVPRRRTELIAGGRPNQALHSTSTAAVVGARSTGNARRATHKAAPRAAPSTLLLLPTGRGEEAGSEHRDAVYLQQLTGAGVGLNAMTGRVDVGCVAALIRGGEVAGRLPTTPLSSSLAAILRAVTAVADDAYQVPFTPVAAATVVCDGGLVGLAS